MTSNSNKPKGYDLKGFFINAVIAITVGVISQLLIVFGSQIIYAVTKYFGWIILFLLPLIGILFYWARLKLRSGYGFVEFIIGYMIAFNVVFPVVFSLTKLINPNSIFQLLGGIYVMVRGMDNFAHGLQNDRIKDSWERLFGSI